MNIETPTSTPAESPIRQHYNELHVHCGEILALSSTGGNESKIARSHLFAQELEVWTSVLEMRRETTLFKMAAHEYQFAILALAQGHYRHAFKGLRLVLELTLQAGHLSIHELELREWLQSEKDTIWATLVNRDNGVLSARYVRSFFPALEKHVAYHLTLAEQVYRECSECVHGNIPKHIPLPDSLVFSQQSFDMWHAKADIIAMLCHFMLVLRYLKELHQNDTSKLESLLIARLGHIQELRVALGGPTGG
jgi:hypothetical protein